MIDVECRSTCSLLVVLFSCCFFAFRVEDRETYGFLAENRKWVAYHKCKKAKGFFSPSESE